MNPSLIFQRSQSLFRRSDKPELVVGNLILNDPDLGINLTLPAASGIVGFQDADSWVRGKSWLPLSLEIKEKYTVVTTPLFSTKVGGLGFHLLPDPVLCSLDESKLRSELLIHEDLGFPGTRGCIGVQKVIGRFSPFNALLVPILLAYHSVGIRILPLAVV